jgi:hypothetical protein
MTDHESPTPTPPAAKLASLSSSAVLAKLATLNSYAKIVREISRFYYYIIEVQ